jgi:F-type H+-transporting ATPase subunit gamma
MRATLSEVAQGLSEDSHPLFEVRDPIRRVEVIVIASDKGLCGGFNSGVAKFAQAFIARRESEGCELTITTAGRRAQEFFKRRRAEQLRDHYPQQGWVAYAQAAEIGKAASARFEAGEVDEVVLVFNEFISAMTQTPKEVCLLPFSTAGESDEESLPYEIEPSAERLLAVLVPKAVEVEIYQALLENQTGEHAARMAAMESATRNTEDLVESLTLQFNRARQAAITRELVEIVSGAEAL